MTKRRYRIASLTKSVTAATVLALVDDGLLDLQAPLTFRLMADGEPRESIEATLHGLLSMNLGTGFEYSNKNYAFVGRAIEQATGQPFAAVVHKCLLDPLGIGMTFSADGPEHPDIYAPAYGLWATQAELDAWLAWLISSAPAAMTVSHTPIGPGHEPFPANAAYGYGLLIEQTEIGTVISHSGALPGYTAHFRWSPVSGDGVALADDLTNPPAWERARRLSGRAGS